MYTYSDYTTPSDCVRYKAYDNVQIYTLISFWFINIIQGKVLQYGICLSRGPINIFRIVYLKIFVLDVTLIMKLYFCIFTTLYFVS